MFLGQGVLTETPHIIVDLNYDNIEWTKKYMIEAIPTGTVYDTKGSDLNQAQEESYLKAGMNPEASLHYANLKNDTSLGSQLNDCFYDVTYFYLPAGNNLWWHKDFYSFFQKKFNIKDRMPGSIHRTIVHLTDWTRGQIFQCADQIAIKWKKGDCYTFPEDVGHGVANFSLQDYVIMQVTWLKKEHAIIK